MSISALGTGLSGMRGAQRALDVSANNIANLATAGFQPQQATFQESAPAGNGVSVTATGGTETQAIQTANAASEAQSGTDYAKEAVNQLTYQFGFDASANVVKTADQMLGTLIDVKA